MPSEIEQHIGIEGERVVKNWLIRQGFMILPASMMNQLGAPMLIGNKYRLILPDNLTWQRGVARWVEVKTKSRPTEHLTNPKRWEHGVDLHCWIHYNIIEQQTQTPVYLAILELETKMLLLSSINSIKANARIFPFKSGEILVFFGRDDFNWYDIDFSLPEPIRPHALRTLLQDKAPIEKQSYFKETS